MELDAWDLEYDGDGGAAMLGRIVALAEEARDLRMPAVPVLDTVPTPLEFYRGESDT